VERRFNGGLRARTAKYVRYTVTREFFIWEFFSKFFVISGANKYGLLTKCEVEMAGFWPSSFFACLWTETESRSINSQKKKNEDNIQPS